MARRRYKSYKRRPARSSVRGRGKKKSNLRWIILLLVIILAGVFVTKKLGTDQTDLNDLINESQRQAEGDNDATGDGTGGGVSPDETIYLPPEKDVATGDEVKARIKAAEKDFATGKVIEARNALNKILHDETLSYKDRADVKQLLSKLSEKWLFSSKVYEGDPLTSTYKVESGDVLSKIGTKYKVPHQILMEINNISAANKLRLGDIKIVKGPFHVKVKLSKYNLDLYLQDQYVRSYPVGIGKEGEETPTGKWRVANEKVVKPAWYDKQNGNKVYVADNPENPLGARWIGIEGTEDKTKDKTDYALHGTNDPDSIGTKCSRGCVRLHEKNIIQLFGMLTPVYSKVEIIE